MNLNSVFSFRIVGVTTALTLSLVTYVLLPTLLPSKAEAGISTTIGTQCSTNPVEAFRFYVKNMRIQYGLTPTVRADASIMRINLTKSPFEIQTRAKDSTPLLTDVKNILKIHTTRTYSINSGLSYSGRTYTETLLENESASNQSVIDVFSKPTPARKDKALDTYFKTEIEFEQAIQKAKMALNIPLTKMALEENLEKPISYFDIHPSNYSIDRHSTTSARFLGQNLPVLILELKPRVEKRKFMAESYKLFLNAETCLPLKEEVVPFLDSAAARAVIDNIMIARVYTTLETRYGVPFITPYKTHIRYTASFLKIRRNQEVLALYSNHHFEVDESMIQALRPETSQTAKR